MGMRRRRSDRSGRGVLCSPGRPGVARREDRRRFWTAIAAGQSGEDAALRAGVPPAVGVRWFREAGGLPPATLAPAAKPPSGRHLSFADREEIALGRVQGHGVREIARRLGRSASTISRELRRNAATRSGAMLPRAAAVWTIAPPPRSGPPSGPRGVQSRRNWRSTRRCGATYRTGWGWSSPRAAAESAMGQGVEPGADCSSPAARLSRR